MKAFFIAVLLMIIASAASAEETVPSVVAEASTEVPTALSEPIVDPLDLPIIPIQQAIAPIVISNGAARAQEPEPTIPPDPTLPANTTVTASADPNLSRAEFSETRKQVESAATRPDGPRFICRGMEPFWMLRIEKETVEFDVLGTGFTKFTAPSALSSLNSALDVTNFTAKSDSNKTISATVIDANRSGIACSDGLSEQTYTHSVFINFGGKLFDGCCAIER